MTAPVRGSSDQLRLAFVIRAFPVVSEMHMFDQVTRLLDRGVDVRIFAFERGDDTQSSRKFADYGLASRVTYVDCPRGWRRRFARAWPKALRLARRQPLVLLRTLNVLRYGRQALSLRLLYAADAVAGAEVDFIHCHFGPTAVEFVAVREVAALCAALGVDDIVRFVSFLPAAETMALVDDAHLLVQPSKMAADGDMD